MEQICNKSLELAIDSRLTNPAKIPQQQTAFKQKVNTAVKALAWHAALCIVHNMEQEATVYRT